MQKGTSTAIGLLLGFALDRSFGDPRRWHPVAGFGSAVAALESVTYADRRVAGLVHEALAVGAVVGLGVAARRGGVVSTAVATWTVLGGRSLARTGQCDGRPVGGRRPRRSSRAAALAVRSRSAGARRERTRPRALESIAENTSDAAVAQVVWGAVAGLPGFARVPRGQHARRDDRLPQRALPAFRLAAARVDDVANLIPARLTGLLTAALAPMIGGRPTAALDAWNRDAAGHPSPNAGVVEASMAGALVVRLGGRTQYPHGVELRPVLGDGPAPPCTTVRRAVRLSEAVQLTATLLAAAVAATKR
nr:cobalamin biosynthesis protein [Nocardia abscessus]